MFNNAACQFNTITYIFLSNNCPYNRCRCLDFQEKRFKIKERTHYVMVMAFHKWIDLNNYLATHQNTFIAKICTRNRKFIFRKAHNR